MKVLSCFCIHLICISFSKGEQQSIGFTARESIANMNLKHNVNKATPVSVSQMHDHPKDRKQNGKGEKTTHFHEIYKHYVAPRHLIFGYLEANNIPKLFEKRLESINGGNHFTGLVTWYNGMGGYGEHRWDLAQGKL